MFEMQVKKLFRIGWKVLLNLLNVIFLLTVFCFCSFKFALTTLFCKFWYSNKTDMTIKNHNHVSQLEEKLLA